jgi:hypothetical protein
MKDLGALLTVDINPCIAPGEWTRQSPESPEVFGTDPSAHDTGSWVAFR